MKDNNLSQKELQCLFSAVRSSPLKDPILVTAVLSTSDVSLWNADNRTFLFHQPSMLVPWLRVTGRLQVTTMESCVHIKWWPWAFITTVDYLLIPVWRRSTRGQALGGLTDAMEFYLKLWKNLPKDELHHRWRSRVELLLKEKACLEICIEFHKLWCQFCEMNFASTEGPSAQTLNVFVGKIWNSFRAQPQTFCSAKQVELSKLYMGCAILEIQIP